MHRLRPCRNLFLHSFPLPFPLPFLSFLFLYSSFTLPFLFPSSSFPLPFLLFLFPLFVSFSFPYIDPYISAEAQETKPEKQKRSLQHKSTKSHWSFDMFWRSLISSLGGRERERVPFPIDMRLRLPEYEKNLRILLIDIFCTWVQSRQSSRCSWRHPQRDGRGKRLFSDVSQQSLFKFIQSNVHGKHQLKQTIALCHYADDSIVWYCDVLYCHCVSALPCSKTPPCSEKKKTTTYHKVTESITSEGARERSLGDAPLGNNRPHRVFSVDGPGGSTLRRQMSCSTGPLVCCQPSRQINAKSADARMVGVVAECWGYCLFDMFDIA